MSKGTIVSLEDTVTGKTRFVFRPPELDVTEPMLVYYDLKNKLPKAAQDAYSARFRRLSTAFIVRDDGKFDLTKGFLDMLADMRLESSSASR